MNYSLPDWCREGQFVCGNSRSCVDRDKVCDGYKDCPGEEDEKKCAALFDDESNRTQDLSAGQFDRQMFIERQRQQSKINRRLYETDSRSEKIYFPTDEERTTLVYGREISSFGNQNSLTTNDNSYNGNARSPGLDVRRELNDYSDRGFLSVRKNGKWGKLCLTGINDIVQGRRTPWSIEDLGRAVCKAITYQ